MNTNREGIVFGLMTQDERHWIRRNHDLGNVDEFRGAKWIPLDPYTNLVEQMAYRIKPEPKVVSGQMVMPGFTCCKIEKTDNGFLGYRWQGNFEYLYKACRRSGFSGFGFVIGGQTRVFHKSVIYLKYDSLDPKEEYYTGYIIKDADYVCFRNITED
jgi:hypothetical protein